MSLTSAPVFLMLAVLSFETQSFDATTPGCHLHPFNVTIRSDHKGTCRGTQVINACVGYCESSAFPSKYSVLAASGYKHNITSVSQCCTISKLQKVDCAIRQINLNLTERRQTETISNGTLPSMVKVRLFCGASRWEEIEIGSAESCQCATCRLSRY